MDKPAAFVPGIRKPEAVESSGIIVIRLTDRRNALIGK
jgi:hypothetical protein